MDSASAAPVLAESSSGSQELPAASSSSLSLGLQPLATRLCGLYSLLQQGGSEQGGCWSSSRLPVCQHSGEGSVRPLLGAAPARHSPSQASHHSRPAAMTSVKGIFQALPSDPQPSRPHCLSVPRASDTQGTSLGGTAAPSSSRSNEALCCSYWRSCDHYTQGDGGSGPTFSSWTI